MQEERGAEMKKHVEVRRAVLSAALILTVTHLVLALSPGAVLPAGGANHRVKVPAQPIRVALTFDDGPHPVTTARLLDELALREVQATFFVVGEFLPDNEPLIRRMAAEGHQIGVHSYSHTQITGLSKENFDLEVIQVRSQLQATLGGEDYWLRPPYGLVDPSVELWADSPIILWSLDPEDWKDRDVNRITNQVLSQVKDGDIILFHDIYESSVDAAIQVVDTLVQQDACFMTVEQLLQAKGITPEQGVIYR